MPAGKGEKRVISQEEKLRAIQRVHNGESKASVARDIGVPESTLRGWCKGEEKIKNDYNNSVNKVNRSIKFEPKDKKPKPHHNLQPYISRPAGPTQPVSPADLPAGLSTTELNELERAKLEELEILLKIPPATAAVFRAQMAAQNQFKLGDAGDSGTSLAAFPLGAIAPQIGLDQLTPESLYANMTANMSANMTANMSLSNLRQQIFKISTITNMLANNNNGTSYSTPQNSYKSSKSKSHQRFSPTYSKSPKKSPYSSNGLLMPSVFPSNLTSPKSNGQFSQHDLVNKSADMAAYNSGILMPNQPVSKALSIDCGSSGIANCSIKTEFLPPQQRLPSPNVSNVVIKVEPPTTPPQITESDPILFNRLTSSGNEDCVAQDLSVSGNKESPGSVLNDNNDDNIDENRENTMSRNEGIHHGQQFLNWLSTCQDEPQITQQNVDYVANMLTKLQNYKKPNTFIKRRRK